MMNAVRRSLAAALSACALASGCADPGERATDQTEAAVEPDSDPTTEPSTEPSQPDASSPAPARSTVSAAAVADLAATLGIEPAAVEVVSEEEVTWSNGSLGCAKDGMSYTQVLVDGSRTVLRADGTDYEYHAGGDGVPFHCENPTE